MLSPRLRTLLNRIALRTRLRETDARVHVRNENILGGDPRQLQAEDRRPDYNSGSEFSEKDGETPVQSTERLAPETGQNMKAFLRVEQMRHGRAGTPRSEWAVEMAQHVKGNALEYCFLLLETNVNMEDWDRDGEGMLTRSCGTPLEERAAPLEKLKSIGSPAQYAVDSASVLSQGEPLLPLDIVDFSRANLPADVFTDGRRSESLRHLARAIRNAQRDRKEERQGITSPTTSLAY
ncbi:hypothetical protein EBH_0014440 [Eimeria brunetti]|uniref:Uncharacterized protein n=1 Tax=Eimeria brunetti TaxID=51314 RepID=U6LGZ5_9EIME|nr:hypothetical protein EBH_0014440 [Eimeria brunetti]